MFLYPKLIMYAGTALVAWFIYGWGFEVINRYTEMPKTIQRLERDNTLITTRVASYRTLLARRDAAIAASKCSAQIQDWVKNPDTIPTEFNPFNKPVNGGQ
jgi:hypothetical protein